eukprot:1148569-Pelagomonas_calceolata.AAC.4
MKTQDSDRCARWLCPNPASLCTCCRGPCKAPTRDGYLRPGTAPFLHAPRIGVPQLAVFKLEFL